MHLVWYFSRSDCLRPALQQQEPLLPALLSLLASPDAASARAAAFALNNLALDAACRCEPEHNPRHLQHHMNHDSLQSRSRACTTLSGDLSPLTGWACWLVVHACRHRIVEAGAIAGLIDMLSGCDALGQEAAAAALQMLASEEGNIRATIVACNGVQALVAVLRYGGPAAQEAAASALENLSLDDACEAALAQDGAVEALLQVLKDGTTGTQVGVRHFCPVLC